MPSVPSGASPKLLDRLRTAIRGRHYSRRTEKAYVGWVRRHKLFSGLQHPDGFDERQVLAFVTMLARDRRISASTQNQALCAVLFLYRNVLDRLPEWGATLVRAHRPVRLPVVLSKSEVAGVLRPLQGPVRLVCELLYGSGLRLLEALTLRIKDVDFDRGEVRVRDGKARVDRVRMLPARVRSSLVPHLETTRRQHELDVLEGAGFVALPDGLSAKCCTPRGFTRRGVLPCSNACAPIRSVGTLIVRRTKNFSEATRDSNGSCIAAHAGCSSSRLRADQFAWPRFQAAEGGCELLSRRPGRAQDRAA